MNSTRNKSTTPDNEKDLAQTPFAVVRQLEAILGMRIVLDVCAAAATAKADRFFCAPNASDADKLAAMAADALALEWKSFFVRAAAEHHFFLPAASGTAPAAYMNPPFSRLAEFCEKAAEQARDGVPVIGCVKDDRTTKWYQKSVERAATFVLVPDGRIQYLKEDGSPFKSKKTGQKTSADFTTVFPVWLPYRAPGAAITIPFNRNWIKRGSKE